MDIWLDSPPSLRQASLVETTKSLWISYHLRYTPKEYSRFTDTRTYSQVIHFEKQLQNVVLPSNVKLDIVSTFLFMNWELKFWLEQHDFSQPSIYWLPLLRWTAHGHIDGRKTAQVIVEDARIDRTIRFRFACLHCLEEDIRKLNNPGNFYGKALLEWYRGFGDHILTPFWSYFVENQLDKFQKGVSYKHEYSSDYHWSRDTNVIQEVAKMSGYASFAALEHFWPRLTKEQKCTMVVELAYNRPAEYDKSLIFIMNKINLENLIIHDQKIFLQILCKFTELPYRRYFWKLLERMINDDTLTKRDFYKIFHRVGRNYLLACHVLEIRLNRHLETLVKDYGKNFLHYFWIRIPLAYKVDLLGNLELVDMIDKLFQEGQYCDAMLECKKRSLWQIPVND